MTIKDLPFDARPREKMLARGPGALSDVELLAILLRTGMAGKNVFQLAQELLETFGGLSGLLNTGATELNLIKGLGPAKRAEVVAVLELSRRGLAEQLRERQAFHAPEAVKAYVQLHLAHKNHEVFAVLFLDSQNRLQAMEELFRGTLSQTSVSPPNSMLWTHTPCVKIYGHRRGWIARLCKRRVAERVRGKPPALAAGGICAALCE